MPRRRDLRSICVIGSGPIVIGQACEFDYAGCQALKVLREEGFRTIVVNSNPATIMTDPGFADRTYVEPLDLEGVDGRARAGASRCAAADARRPDRPQPRDRAGRGGRARRAGNRADRRRRRRDPPRRGSRALPRDGPPRRATACRSRRSSRAGRTSRAELSFPVDPPAGVHARRARRRHGATATTSSRSCSSARSARAPSARCSSRSP